MKDQEIKTLLLIGVDQMRFDVLRARKTVPALTPNFDVTSAYLKAVG